MEIRYWCPTEKSAKALLRQWKKQGYAWINPLISLDYTYWNIFKKNTVYHLKDGLIYLDSKRTYDGVNEYIPENTIYNLIKEREYDRKSLLVPHREAS